MANGSVNFFDSFLGYAYERSCDISITVDVEFSVNNEEYSSIEEAFGPIWPMLGDIISS